jgi:hypothetical protein
MSALVLALVSACDSPRDVIGPDGRPLSAQLDHSSSSGSCVDGGVGIIISISPTQVEVGAQSIFYVSILDAAGNQLPSLATKWSIADQTIATPSVDGPSGHASGIGKKAGTTDVTATCGSLTATARLTVAGGSVTGATANFDVTIPATQLSVGQSTQAVVRSKVTHDGSVAASDIAWSISNPAVASVNSTGLVTAIASGTATVSATVAGATSGVDISVSGSTTPPTQPTPPTSVDPGSGVTAAVPELPRATVDARYVAPTGRTINVPAGGDLQAAINSANRGDVITLAPGATYVGPFNLRQKSGDGWITIRTAASDGSLPSADQRITPSYASALPKLVGGAANAPVVLTSSAASGYRIMGVEIAPDPSVTVLTSLIELGEGGGLTQKSLSDVPYNFVLDRVYVHGNNTNLQRCISLNSANTAIVNSWITECHGISWDSQAIAGWNGPGPYLIENNQLEGSGENIMFGGADASINGLSPSDITIRRNHIRKPPEWRGSWLVKNLFELKHAKRVLIESNVFENNWADAQDGVAIVMKSTNQSGGNPWAQTADVTFRYNIVRNSPQGVNLAANPELNLGVAIPATRFLFDHNLFENIGTFNGTTNGNMIVMTNYLSDVTFTHNTLNFNYSEGILAIMESLPILSSARRIVLNDNVVTKGRYYQIAHSGIKVGTESMNAFAGSSWSFNRNVVVGVDPEYVSWHPQSSFYPTTMAEVGFSAAANGDYRLAPSSQYKGKATDGSDPGADFDELNRRVSGVVVR